MESRYELILYWSKDDQRFIVEVPELPGCMADGSCMHDRVRITLELVKRAGGSFYQLSQQREHPARDGGGA